MPGSGLPVGWLLKKLVAVIAVMHHPEPRDKTIQFDGLPPTVSYAETPGVTAGNMAGRALDGNLPARECWQRFSTILVSPFSESPPGRRRILHCRDSSLRPD